MEDAESLGNIIVESQKAAYSNIIPEDEMAKFLDKERRKRQFERFIENGEIILIGIYNNGQKKIMQFVYLDTLIDIGTFQQMIRLQQKKLFTSIKKDKQI